MGQPYKEYLMKKETRVLVSGTAVLSLAIGFLAAGSGGAADDKADLRATLQKIADAIEKKDSDQAKKLAEDVAKNNDLEDVMHLMSKRDPAGKAKVFGVGKKPGAIQPDGIEAKVQNMGKRALPQKQIDKESADLTEMAYRIAAISEVAHAKPPEKEDAKKKKKDWLEWSADMKKNALALAEAAQAKKPTEIKNAVANLNTTCNTCHGVFRDE
jgi:soluble cytochrome b562